MSKNDSDESEKRNRQLQYWYVSGRRISHSLAPPEYRGMSVERARRVRDELSEAIERIENA